MIQITLNGKSTEIEDNTNASDLLKKMEISSKRIAIEVNETILPRSQFENYIFNQSDKVEIVHAIGGG